MKLKTHPDFPEKKEYNAARLTLRYIQAFNQARAEIGELELSLDVEKIEKILNQDVPYLESSSNKIDRVHASIQRANNKTYANCIAKAFNSGEITK